jgi:Flp pilus assembly pilin Flp
LPQTIDKLAGDDAQTMAEYAVVLGVITLAIVTTFATMAGSIQSVLEGIVGVFS